MKTINLGLIGLGTVGKGTVRVLQQNKEVIKKRLGADLVMNTIADIDIETDRGLDLSDVRLTRNANEVINDPSIDIVIELIGGYSPAKEFILEAIDNGKHIVTANKALLARDGEEIFNAVCKKGVDIGFEASVGGVIPIIRSIREGFAGNTIESIHGIVNGTSNYILSRMTDESGDFNEVLREAQQKGYAEIDPSFDVDGIDSAHKIAILASIAFGSRIRLDDVYTEGISHISQLDISFASEFGYRVKLLAIAKQDDDVIDVRVHPAMVKRDKPISNVNGVLNAIEVIGDMADDNMLIGRGAGAMPTGSAVVGDIVEIGRSILKGIKGRIPPLSYHQEEIQRLKIKSIDDIESEYYLRFMVIDKPGVLSNISGILGEHSISIASVIQKFRSENGEVPLIIMTHSALERNVQAAVCKINNLDIVLKDSVLIRVEE